MKSWVWVLLSGLLMVNVFSSLVWAECDPNQSSAWTGQAGIHHVVYQQTYPQTITRVYRTQNGQVVIEETQAVYGYPIYQPYYQTVPLNPGNGTVPTVTTTYDTAPGGVMIPPEGGSFGFRLNP